MVKDAEKKKAAEKPAVQAPPAEEPPPQPATAKEVRLRLPADHPVNQLWKQYGRSAAAPYLRLELPKEGLLTEEEAAEELPRLEALLTAAAQSRLNAPAGSDLDAQVLVFLPVRRMAAWMFVYPPQGRGAAVSQSMAAEALAASGVTYGIDEALLSRLAGAQDRYFHLFPAALGDPPVHGEDGCVIDLFSRDPAWTAVGEDSAPVDFNTLDPFQNAKKGDVICRLVAPTPCCDGRTVQDETAYARAGQPAFLPRGRNTEISEDGESLLASCDGHVEFSGRSFQVKPVMDIGGSVDFSTGDISCLGDIHIHGDVCSGYTVRATGSITVDGVIESCVVEAGGDLVVRKGVQGNNQAVLRAHRSIFARYLESSRIYAREDLEAECVINCDVFSDGAVTVRSGRGTIIGGQVRAARKVSANIIGARSECMTSIILGGRPCEAFEREGLLREIQELEAELEKSARRPDAPGRQPEMARLRVQISANKMKLQQFDKTLDQEDHLPGGRVLCSTIYPGAEITMGESSLKVTEERSGCTIGMVDGEVQFVL